MFSSVLSAVMTGMECHLVQVEVSVTEGLPAFEMVGCLSSQVKEAKERVKIALYHSGIVLPPKHITVNISPANIRKDGNAFDLPIAIGIMSALGMVSAEKTENILILGELGLAGEVKAVKGILPALVHAKERGIKKYLIPKENEKEGIMASSEGILSVLHLKDTVRILNMEEKEQEQEGKRTLMETEEKPAEGGEDFSEINGQSVVKRAAEIAAAGFHNLLLNGPPGAGKTMIAKRIPTILPSLSKEESMELSKIYSVAGMLSENQPNITKRPFLNPHHTVSAYALAGGGRIPQPGIITLAHRGVLFLDELPEFKKEALEILRQPIEEKKIHIARTYGNFTYPCDFMLIAAQNPCPCGHYPNVNRCSCSEYEIRRYRQKVSGPLLDRIDIFADILPVSIKDLTNTKKNETSESIRRRIEKAREMQRERYQAQEYSFNGAIVSKDIKKYCSLGKEETSFVEEIFAKLKLSARGYYRMLKVARTIADLEEKEKIETEHLSEAACYRNSIRKED